MSFDRVLNSLSTDIKVVYKIFTFKILELIFWNRNFPKYIPFQKLNISYYRPPLVPIFFLFDRKIISLHEKKKFSCNLQHFFDKIDYKAIVEIAFFFKSTIFSKIVRKKFFFQFKCRISSADSKSYFKFSSLF